MSFSVAGLAGTVGILMMVGSQGTHVALPDVASASAERLP
jgi:hypothetical protein